KADFQREGRVVDAHFRTGPVIGDTARVRKRNLRALAACAAVAAAATKPNYIADLLFTLGKAEAIIIGPRAADDLLRIAADNQRAVANRVPRPAHGFTAVSPCVIHRSL